MLGVQQQSTYNSIDKPNLSTGSIRVRHAYVKTYLLTYNHINKTFL